MLERRTAPSRFWLVFSPFVAIASAGAAAYVCLQLAGLDGPAVLYDFFLAPLLDEYMRVEILGKAAPLLLCALGLAVCYRANVWNIGAEGQFVLGAVAASALALNLTELTAYIAIPVVIAAGTLAGLLWSFLAAALRVWLGVSEILTTIMLNYVALHLLAYLVNGPLRNPQGFNFPESALFSDNVMLPSLHPDFYVPSALLLCVLLAAVFWILHARSLFGFKLRLLGLDPASLAYLKTRPASLTIAAMLISGTCAGLAGALEMIGPVGQLTMNVSFGYGYTAIVVAFLGRLHPLAIVIAALVLSLTYIGGENLQIMHELPAATTSIFQGALLLCLLSTDALSRYRIRLPRRPSLQGAG